MADKVYSNESVAELTVGTAVSLYRNLTQVEERCRNEGIKDGLIGRELKGHVVGIIGCGAIGTRVAELFHAFGCSILAYSRHKNDSWPEYIRYLPMEDVIRDADILTLHCPQTDETKGLMNRKRIGMMKKDAVLINMARGAVVDSAALADALNEGRIAGAVVDVFEKEPPISREHPLVTAKNCLVTPHVAFATQESMELRAKIVFDSLNK